MSASGDLHRFLQRDEGPETHGCLPQTGLGSRLEADHEAALIELGRVTKERDQALRELARAHNLTPDHPEYQRIWALGWVAGHGGSE
jgi:hypothetical protein